MILTPSQRKDYAKAVKEGRQADEFAILRRNLILKHSNDWWREHREEVKQELAALEKREECDKDTAAEAWANEKI